jgi:hypothetical protein
MCAEHVVLNLTEQGKSVDFALFSSLSASIENYLHIAQLHCILKRETKVLAGYRRQAGRVVTSPPCICGSGHIHNSFRYTMRLLYDGLLLFSRKIRCCNSRLCCTQCCVCKVIHSIFRFSEGMAAGDSANPGGTNPRECGGRGGLYNLQSWQRFKNIYCRRAEVQ